MGRSNPDEASRRTTAVPEPTLTRLDAPAPRAVVLMLHGGKEHSTQPVDGRSASWRRMAALQHAVTPRLHEAGVSTWLLRYRTRGWDGGASKVQDTRWALDEIRTAVGEVPVVLLGHSMGGRTAVHVADHPQVAGVVALAP
jgi:alpha-beta hydrolase superfamily lysophospholipase